jgi:hypothetical protein
LFGVAVITEALIAAIEDDKQKTRDFLDTPEGLVWKDDAYLVAK